VLQSQRLISNPTYKVMVEWKLVGANRTHLEENLFQARFMSLKPRLLVNRRQTTEMWHDQHDYAPLFIGQLYENEVSKLKMNAT
jgi:hypothetical protein